ncbi:hypothetical protein EV363DRAFT_1346689, partial [Boletus edulis]
MSSLYARDSITLFLLAITFVMPPFPHQLPHASRTQDDFDEGFLLSSVLFVSERQFECREIGGRRTMMFTPGICARMCLQFRREPL